MAIRRLARFAANQAGQNVTTWTTQATSTYDPNNPGAGAASWGTTPEVANLDRDFDATGSLKTHLGALLTFTSLPDTFWGAVVKIVPTYSTLEDPKLELWTFDGATWTKRRRVDLPAIARSGDTVIVDLVLSQPLTGVTKVWITMAPTATETLSWIALHLFGDCNVQIVTPDCPAFSDPPDCGGDCDTLFPQWTCDPEDPTPPTTVPFPFPPVIVTIPMPTIPFSTSFGGTFVYTCPAPNKIRMFFDIRHPNAQVVVSVLLAPGIVFAEGGVQTITGSGSITWTVLHGYKYRTTPTDAYLPPNKITPVVKFLFTPRGDFTVLDLLDWEQFLWTYSIVAEELC